MPSGRTPARCRASACRERRDRLLRKRPCLVPTLRNVGRRQHPSRPSGPSRQMAPRRGDDLSQGPTHWLWRAAGANSEELVILVSGYGNAAASKRFLRKLMRQWGMPRVIVSDKLRSNLESSPKRRAPRAQGIEQPIRSLASTHKTARKDHGSFQISVPSAATSVC